MSDKPKDAGVFGQEPDMQWIDQRPRCNHGVVFPEENCVSCLRTMYLDAQQQIHELNGEIETLQGYDPDADSCRLIYNKETKKIDRVRNFDGLTVDSFDPPTE